MANTVLIQTRCAAENVDALNRSAVVAASATQNGAPLTLTFPTTAGTAVFTGAASSAAAKNVWLAYSPEVNKLVVGQIWGGADPRNFTNVAGKPFDVFKPQVGDIIQVTTPFFVTQKDPGTVSTATVVELTSNGFEAKTSATSAYAGISFNVGRAEPIIIANGTVGGEQVDAWYLECTQN